MWDQRRLVRQWLETQGALTYQQDFARVQVLRYTIR
jgi:hypothetical protein